jgi:hypothetical protein
MPAVARKGDTGGAFVPEPARDGVALRERGARSAGSCFKLGMCQVRDRGISGAAMGGWGMETCAQGRCGVVHSWACVDTACASCSRPWPHGRAAWAGICCPVRGATVAEEAGGLQGRAHPRRSLLLPGPTSRSRVAARAADARAPRPRRRRRPRGPQWPRHRRRRRPRPRRRTLRGGLRKLRWRTRASSRRRRRSRPRRA